MKVYLICKHLSHGHDMEVHRVFGNIASAQAYIDEHRDECYIGLDPANPGEWFDIDEQEVRE